MPNVKFNYLYRDSGNYKRYGSVIFANRNKIDLLELEALIKSKLINETWFYADEWGVPEIFTKIIDFRVDPTWHEFESAEYTDNRASRKIKLTDFLNYCLSPSGSNLGR